jgi:hypothetical protein
MVATYKGCYNLCGNAYFYSANIGGATACFNGRNTSNMLNIYVVANSVSMNTLLQDNIAGLYETWTNDIANSRYYNTAANIYIYPVANVEAAREANGD